MIKIYIFTFLFTFSSLFASDEKTQENYEPSFGLGASINTAQTSVYLPFVLESGNILAPVIAFTSNDKTSVISLGFQYKNYMTKINKVQSYFTFGGAYGTQLPKNSNGNTNVDVYSVGLGYGLEYFFTKNISIGTEANVRGELGFVEEITDNPYEYGTSYSSSEFTTGIGMVLYATIYL